MPRPARTILVLCLIAGSFPLPAQRVSFGFIGGTNLTRDFPISRTLYNDIDYPAGLTTFDLYSESRGFMAGVSVELSLSDRFAFEANAIHRTLHLKRRFILPGGEVRPSGEVSVDTWQAPLLLKYRFHSGPVRPFIQGGISFRTRDNPAPTEPSQFGGTAGAGVDFQLGRIRISPGVRYTRWKYDGDFPRFATKRDQIEFVTGVSYATSPASWRFGGKKIDFGVIAGVPFTGGLVRPRYPGFTIDEEVGYAAGLMVEVALNRKSSIEADGIYRPFRAFYVTDFEGAQFRSEFTVLTWQIPVLAKYRMGEKGRFQPVLEAGPSFRLSGNLNGYNPSSVGVTAGAGAETSWRGMKIGPVLRYTRWARDSKRSNFAPQTKHDQIELLVGFSF